MEYTFLSKNVAIKKVSEDESVGVFEITNLYTGYGLTLGNALRRILLSSLPGAAITQVKIKGVKHEFSSMNDVLEDVVDIILNLKTVRFKFYADEPQVLSIKKKGEGKVTAADIESTSEVQVVNPEAHIATLTSKSAEFEAEITVEKGLGYSPAESRKAEKLPIGAIALDAIFSPVTNVNFEVVNMRVGDRTDFNKLTLTIQTDKTVSASRALHKAANILKDHLEVISAVDITDFAEAAEEAPKEKKAKKSAKNK